MPVGKTVQEEQNMAVGRNVNADGGAEKRTLLASVLLSAPGPIVVGLGLLAGRSSTQLADFLRRSAELAAIVCAYVVFRIVSGNGSPGDGVSGDGAVDEVRRAELERGANRFIGAMMCVAGIAMGVVSVLAPATDKGNVIPGLAIALLGFVTNGILWRRYSALDSADPNAIMAAQARLYRAKTLVDCCVSAALATVLLAPGTGLAQTVDLLGSLFVSVYMVFSGAQTTRLA